MENLMKCALVAMSVCVFAIPASAESYVAAPMSVQDTVVKKDTVVKEEAPLFFAQNDEVTYSKVEVAAVPEAVVNAVAAKYEGCSIEEAFKGTDNSYKLAIKKGDTTLTVYYSESGEFIKEETEAAKTEGVMLT